MSVLDTIWAIVIFMLFDDGNDNLNISLAFVSLGYIGTKTLDEFEVWAGTQDWIII